MAGSGFSISGLVDDMRNFFYDGIQTFPLAIGGALLILGLMTSNYAILFFLIGYLVLVPISAYGANLVVDTVVHRYNFTKKWFQANGSDLCNVFIPFGDFSNKQSAVPGTAFNTVWLSMTVFFFSYMMTNAISLLTTKPELKEPEKIAHRKMQAMISIVVITLAFVFIVFGRYKSDCETIGGIIWTILMYGGFGVGWYSMLSSIGQNRLSDLFGIANRLLSPYAVTNEPVACFPIAA